MNAPKLRFKGFNLEWSAETLEKYLTFNNGINAEKDSYGHGRKFINVLDILNNNSITYDKIIGSVSVSARIEESNKVDYGDVLFLRSSETREDVGKSSVYLDKEEHALFGGFVIRGKKKSEYNPYFLKLNLETPNIRNQIGSKSGGSTRFNVSQSILSSVELNMPTVDEQIIIAEFFEKLDMKIQKQQEKVGLLENQKKGLMQKIFSQELRFKDESGQDYPEWKDTTLGEIAEIVGGGTPSTTNDLYWNGEITWFTPTEISNNKFVSQSKRSISKEGLQSSSAKLLPKGTVLLTTRATLGEMAILIEQATTNQGFQSLLPNEQTTSEFIYYLQPQLRKYCYFNASGSTFLEISKHSLKKMPLLLPCKKEQNKISIILAEIDSKINLEEDKLQQLNTQKQALLQQMFM